MQYINGVGTTLLVTALALALGVVLGSVVALVRVTHDQQRPGHKNAVLGFFNAVCQVYTTIIRGTPMMVQLLIMSMVIFSNSRNFTMVGALTLGINSGAYVSEIIRGGLMAVDPARWKPDAAATAPWWSSSPPASVRCCLHWATSSRPLRMLPFPTIRQKELLYVTGHYDHHLCLYSPLWVAVLYTSLLRQLGRLPE